MKADITDNGRAEIPTLVELMTAHILDPDCCIAFTSLGKPNANLNVDRDGKLALISPSNFVLKRVVPVSLHPRTIHLSQFFLLAGHPGEDQMNDFTRKKL